MGAIPKEVENRMFKNKWICMRCNSNVKGKTGSKPEICRNCGAKSAKFRLKKKPKKTGAK